MIYVFLTPCVQWFIYLKKKKNNDQNSYEISSFFKIKIFIKHLKVYEWSPVTAMAAPGDEMLRGDQGCLPLVK